jgi:hypothetical protein
MVAHKYGNIILLPASCDAGKNILVTANDFGSSKTNPARAKAQNIIFLLQARSRVEH